MFKIVLCALLAFAVAEPEPEPSAGIAPYYAAPAFGYSSTYLAPTTTITKTASSYIGNPYLYSSSPYYPHFIKKRSAPFYAAGSYIAPANYAYSAYSAPLVTSSYSTPLVHSAPVLASPLAYSGATHFIKKRSVPLLPSTYIAPTTYAASALLTTPYAYTAGAPIVNSAPLLSSPFGYSHFIKKRSVAPLLPYSSGYIAPASASYSYSASAPLLTSTYGAAPIVSASPYYSAPFGYSTFIKK